MLLDIIFGLIIAILSNFTFGTPESKAAALLFGVFCALAPDIDFIIYIFRNKFKIDQFAHEHRDLLHKPLFFIAIGIPLFLISPEMGMIWIIGTLYHFIHDTIDGGWGIMWLYPFSRNYYTLTSYSPKKIIPTKEEQHSLAMRYGDPYWFKKEIRFSSKMALKVSLAIAIIFTAVAII
jgi:hypothetical protein